MLTGLRSAIFTVDDIATARDWYAALLGAAPTFDQPFYVGFCVGGFELGLSPRQAPMTAVAVAELPASSLVAYWEVLDLAVALERLQAAGATLVAGPQDVGGDIVLAHVLDPFGNALGVIRDPHFRSVLGQPGASPGDVSTQHIELFCTLALSPAEVFALWTTPAGMASWWVSDCELELALGGAFRLRFDTDQPAGLQGSEDCRVLSWLPDRMLSFSWNAPSHLPTRGQRTLVVIELSPVAGGTRLCLTHHGWPTAGLADASTGWPQTFAYFQRAWAAVLERLPAVVLGTAPDSPEDV